MTTTNATTGLDTGELARYVATERRAALNRYYASDKTDDQALGRALALLELNHWLADRGVDVYGGESADARPDFLSRMEHKHP